MDSHTFEEGEGGLVNFTRAFQSSRRDPGDRLNDIWNRYHYVLSFQPRQCPAVDPPVEKSTAWNVATSSGILIMNGEEVGWRLGNTMYGDLHTIVFPL